MMNTFFSFSLFRITPFLPTFFNNFIKPIIRIFSQFDEKNIKKIMVEQKMMQQVKQQVKQKENEAI